MNAEAYLSGAISLSPRRGPIHVVVDSLALHLNQVLALLILVLLAPVMGIVAFLIWRRDGAPVLFAHYRVGHDGKLFRCMKFRTMYRDAERMLSELLEKDPAARAEWQREQKLLRDPRVTPIGHFLRRTSLDELPQLFNVLFGHMSLVGPRPLPVDETRGLEGEHRRRLAMRPGLTCLWQVSGRNDLSFREWMALDLAYVDRWSLVLDFALLLRTVPAIVRGRGAR